MESGHIKRVSSENLNIWANLCNEFWPHHTVEEIISAHNDGGFPHEFLYEINNEYVAFMSLSIRSDYVEGKKGREPVGYLEAIYVRTNFQRKGIGRELVDFAKDWSLKEGCSMLASDCQLENSASRAFHNSMGFEEVSVNVHFAMEL
ncbi:MAG: GNAT family N-acetyltransferase [Tissierellia bacterium]|nr:GNAT family N-acetyltransferase [Tissierellia bacterium]